MLDISISTSKWHLANGRKKLSETLKLQTPDNHERKR